MAPCTFEAARAIVIRQVLADRRLDIETIDLDAAAGRVLATDVTADRDCPAAARSVRDGFAVLAADLPGRLRVIGEVAAGAYFQGNVNSGECVEIMTGAPVPEGCDAVVMVEHTARDGDWMSTTRTPKPGEFINPKGLEAVAGAVVIECGQRISFAQIAMAASVGATRVDVFRQPRVAILSTGDEVVPIDQSPAPNQVRNSNAWSLAVQVRRAGGVPVILDVARDTKESTRRQIEKGLEHDMLLLSGGVSAGRYDVVEPVLAELGAEFFFDRVLIQPGQPLVFGRARGKFFFGLPGNPASTMVTFEVFGRAAVELLNGQRESQLTMPLARLTSPFRHKTGLTRFLPARLSEDGSMVTHIAWQGSGDVPSLARADAFLVADAAKENWEAGEWIRVLIP